MRIRNLAAAVVTAAALTIAGCSAADTASWNISQDSDNFKVTRRVTFVNGITDKYLLTIEGLCSIKDSKEDNSKGHSRSPARSVTAPTRSTSWACPTT
jgi:hypothetical protein